MKKLITLCMIALASCGGSSSGSKLDTTTKYLASNIIFSSASASGLKKQAATVDTDTQILASNVIIDPTDTSVISENLQSMIQETYPDLDASLSGTTWSAVFLKSENITNGEVVSDSADITFNADGTLTLDSSFYNDDALVGIMQANDSTECPDQKKVWTSYQNLVIIMRSECIGGTRDGKGNSYNFIIVKSIGDSMILTAKQNILVLTKK